jgi:hypothetical protein
MWRVSWSPEDWLQGGPNDFGYSDYRPLGRAYKLSDDPKWPTEKDEIGWELEHLDSGNDVSTHGVWGSQEDLARTGLIGKYNPKWNDYYTEAEAFRVDGLGNYQYFSFEFYSSALMLYSQFKHDVRLDAALRITKWNRDISEASALLIKRKQFLAELRARGSRFSLDRRCLCDHGPRGYLTYCKDFFYEKDRRCIFCSIKDDEFHIDEWTRERDLFEKVLPARLALIDRCQAETEELYREIFDECIREHKIPWMQYQRGLLNFHEGRFDEALFDVLKLIEASKDPELAKSLPPEVYFHKGAIESEVGLYDDAIISFTQVIEKNPKHKEAYFERAVSYFERGEFDLALKDYLLSEVKTEVEPITFSVEYASGLAAGIKKGIEYEFGEALPAWAPIMNVGLWAIMNSPSPSAKLVSATLGCVAAVGVALTADQMVTELRDLVTNWDQLSQQDRGELTGFIIGKYGIDVFVAYGSAKCMETYSALKKANQALTFEVVLGEKSSFDAINKRWNTIEKSKNDQSYIQKTFGRAPHPEAKIRETLKTLGYEIPPRPESIPENFTTRFSKKGCGISYHNPLNPEHEYIRLSPGKPHSSNPAQQKPYVIDMKNGMALSKNGIRISENEVKAHIPSDEYIYRPLE